MIITYYRKGAIMKKFVSMFVFSFAMLLALFPCIASAQDSAQRFDGAYITADFVGGIGRIDDKLFNGRGDDYDKKTYAFAWQFQLEAGYLWGSKVLVGPAVMVSGGIPSLVNGALLLKVAIPVDDANAFHVMAGFGGTLHFGYEDTLFDDSVMNFIYIPIQIGYEHVFENNFILGIIFHTDITFNHKEVYPNPKEDYNKTIIQNDAILSLAGLGIRVGYKF